MAFPFLYSAKPNSGGSSGNGTGTVTSVGLSLPNDIFTVEESPVTSSGVITASFIFVNPNTVFAGSTGVSSSSPSFRTLVANDIPTIPSSKINGLTANLLLFGSGSSGVGQSQNLSFSGNQLQVNNFVVDSNSSIYGYRGKYNTQSSSFTISETDCGKILETTGNSTGTITLPGTISGGFVCSVTQYGSGTIIFSASGGATLRNRQGHTGTAGKYAKCCLEVRQNLTGSGAEWILGGDTA